MSIALTDDLEMPERISPASLKTFIFICSKYKEFREIAKNLREGTSFSQVLQN